MIILESSKIPIFYGDLGSKKTMLTKPIISLFIFILISVLVGVTLYSDNLTQFNTKAKAQNALDEGRQITDAMNVYAAKFGDGKIDIGNVAEGEDPLVYIKSKKLLLDRVGNSLSSQIESWEINEENNTIQGVLKSEDICKHMNLEAKGRPLSEPIPLCGDDETRDFPCCVRQAAN